MQIARLCSAGVLPAAREEMAVIPAKMRGEEERWNATRECDKMSRTREPRRIMRSKATERVRSRRAKLGGNSERGMEEGTWEAGLKVDIRNGISRRAWSARTAPTKLM
jgi:hypothetical protein